MDEQEKADELYLNAYNNWCNELSYDKNHLQAKNISIYICNEVLGYMGADRGYSFWQGVKQILEKR